MNKQDLVPAPEGMSQNRGMDAGGAIGAMPGKDISLGELVGLFHEFKWVIAAVTLSTFMLGVIWVIAATPIYLGVSTVQVESKKGALPGLKEIEDLFGSEPNASAEVEILTSRMVLGKVVENLGLTVKAVPATFPVFGKSIARWRSPEGDLQEPLFGLSRWAWGGEKIRVSMFEVPRLNLTLDYTLVKDGENTYQLFFDDKLVLSGQVGVLAEAPGVKLRVSELRANIGTRFRLTKFSFDETIENLRENYVVKENSKGSGVIGVSLLWPDRAEALSILDSILGLYVRQNVERRSAEAESTLKFLEGQLPKLKSQLERSEELFNDYRKSQGSVDLTLEAQGILQSIVDIDKDIVKLQLERDDARAIYTEKHPKIESMDVQIERLKAKRKTFDRAVAGLPSTQQVALRLKRDVDVNTELYTGLLNSSQELQVSRAGTIGDVRILDSASTAIDPVQPKVLSILAGSLLLGLMFSGGTVLAIKALRYVIDSPETIESDLGLPVYAIVPHSADEIAVTSKKGRKKPEDGVLAIRNPDDDAIESIRGLRVAIHFSLLDSAKQAVLFTGPREGIGKSFIAKNLAVVFAQSGKRIALIDGDLRRGHLYEAFKLPQSIGVSEYVSGKSSYEDIQKDSGVFGLTVITTGQRPPNPSELLMHPRFTELFERLCADFDLVFVDAPPVLAVSDAIIIGRQVGATMMVVKSGVHPIGELTQTIKKLGQSGVVVKGVVLNDFDVQTQKYRFGQAGYVYKYTYK